MNSSDITSDSTSDGTPKPEIISTPATPKSRMESIFSEVEMMALQRGGKGGIDFSALDKGQIDKVLETLHKNEENAFTYHTKRLEAMKEIEIKKIDASIVNQSTTRYLTIGILAALSILTFVILLFKDTFFITWLAFITGLLGGFGYSKASSSLSKTSESKNPIQEDEKED